MIDLISTICNEGDRIHLVYNNHNCTVDGVIFKILPSSIAIMTEDGIVGIKADDINTFKKLTKESKEQGFGTDVPTSNGTNPDKASPDETIDQRVPENSQIAERKSEPNQENDESMPTDVQQPSDATQGLSPKEDNKVGDVISHDESGGKSGGKVKKPKDKQKMISLGSGLEALEAIAGERHDKQNQQLVPALGSVKRVFPERNFGFIQDGKSGKDLYFNLNQVIDPSLGRSTVLLYAPVIYNIVESPQGKKATSIHRQATVNELIALASRLSTDKDYRHALDVIEHILAEYPDNYSADVQKKKLLKQIPHYKRNSTSNKEYSDIYNKAKEHHLNKEYSKAISCYLQAIANNEKLPSAIKDLGMLYAELYKSELDEQKKEEYRQAAIKLIDDYGDNLPNNVSTLYYLENFYYSLKDYEDYLDIADDLLNERDVYKVKTKHCSVLYKKAMCLIQLNRTKEAESVIEEGLGIDPQNQAFIKLEDVLQSNSSAEDIIAAISASEFESLNNGLSSFIIQTLENYNEYAGVKTKDIESRNFTKTTLKDVRMIIDRAGSARARERANYLLTEGKLMLELEPTEELRLRTVMARYCNAMALSHISNNSPVDVIRFFYNEAFTLEENYRSNVVQIALYLLTHVHNYTELLGDSRKNNPIDSTLELVLGNGYDSKIWDSILTMFLNNTSISAQIIEKLFKKAEWKSQAVKALSHFGVKNTSSSLPQSDFVTAWNIARENRLRDYQKTITSIKAHGNSSNIEELVLNLFDIKKVIEDWICPLDKKRIYDIVNNIAPAIDTYIKSSGYRNKESNYNNSNGQIEQLIEDIIERPTKLSYEAILPLMEKVQNTLSSSFEEVVRMSEPRINIKLLSSETVVNGDMVLLQIGVENHKDSSPIREVSMTILSTDDILFIDEINTSYDSIEGGDNYIFKLRIKVSDKVIQNKATALDAICRYKSGTDTKEYKSQLSLKLYSPSEFKEIDNPYSPVADGGPVPVTSNMFYGRDEFISNIANSILRSPSKQIIIYGQKRCGKSSVMLHLKEKLLETEKTFCIFFSMGDIINKLSEASFYYKILSSIESELEFMELDDKIVPEFKIPNYSDFKNEDEDNPLNTFTRYMIKFKMACKKTEGWTDKNLVVMIDEFTYLYTEIKKGKISPSIMKQWKAVTQNERAQFSVVLVGQDVVPSFKKEEYASNAFGVIQDIRLTYLEEQPARELIVNPILDENKESRYIGNAVTRILEYTSRNPYYIQIFCARLVEYMNKNKSIKVTEADVNDVARSFVSGDQALEIDKFDNLIRAGESEDLQEVPEIEIFAILRQIAVSTKNIPYCKRADINSEYDSEEEDRVLQHLVDREVLEKKGEDNYKIQVKLFQEWLLNH